MIQEAIAASDATAESASALKHAAMSELFTRGLGRSSCSPHDLSPAPDSWPDVPLSSLARIKHGYAFEGDHFAAQGEFVLLTPGNFYEGGGFREQGVKTKYFTGDLPSGFLLEKGDLLIVMTEQKAGLLGAAGFVPEGGRFLHNQRLGLFQDLDTHG